MGEVINEVRLMLSNKEIEGVAGYYLQFFKLDVVLLIDSAVCRNSLRRGRELKQAVCAHSTDQRTAYQAIGR